MAEAGTAIAPKRAKRGVAKPTSITVGVDHSAAYRGGLQPDVESDVGSERRPSPSAPVRRNKADDSEGGYRAARTRAAHNQRQAARFQRGHIAEFDGPRYRPRRISGRQYLLRGRGQQGLLARRGHRQGHLNFFVAA